MIKVAVCLGFAVAVCATVLNGWLNAMPLPVLNIVFPASVVVALVCSLVLGLTLGTRVMRWALFLDDPKPEKAPAPTGERLVS